MHVGERPTPVPADDQVLVRMLAASVNPIDYKMRDGSSGAVKTWDDTVFPVVLGRDGVGVVEKVGRDISHVAAGDRVVVVNDAGRTDGTYAEYALFHYNEVAHVSKNVKVEEAAGLGVAGMTAWNAVHDLGKVTAVDIVLVHGAAGGVGQLITQLAVATGAQVYGTASTRNKERVEGLGATHVDYTQVDFREVTPRPTVIIDGVWFGTYEPSMDHLAEGGRLVILPTLADLGPAKERGIDVSVAGLDPNYERFTKLADMLGRGDLNILVSQTYPLEQAADAHRAVETGHTQGKVVLRIAE